MATLEDVERAIVTGFPESARQKVRAALELYPDLESPRVLLAILALADGDAEMVLHYVEEARKDYRDVLFWAECPDKCRMTRSQVAEMFRRIGKSPPDLARIPEELPDARQVRAEMADRYRCLGAPVPFSLR
jgi:hypothetical protein